MSLPESSYQHLRIPAKGVRSLCWHDDVLIDWVSGGARYHLDGSSSSSVVDYSYRFDAATPSLSGRFAAIYERLGTKGLVLEAGEIRREVNRSFWHAHDYEYPVAFLALPDGREVLAHCPGNGDVICIEEPVSGIHLAALQIKKFYHSRLAANPDGTKLLSAGWVWHPANLLQVFDVRRSGQIVALSASDHQPNSDGEINSAAFVGADSLILTSAFDAEDDYIHDEHAPHLTPGTIGLYDLNKGTYLSVASLEEEAGTLMPISLDHVVGFFEYPKPIDVRSGRVLHRWRDLSTAKQTSCILRGQGPIPAMALDGPNRRFAVADEAGITVVRLPSEL